MPGTSLAIQFEDAALETNIFSVSTGDFNLGSLTTVSVALAWTGLFDPTQITGWSIGGGNVGIAAYNMTFENMVMVAAIPEPSTYAAIFGALALGFVAYRRRQQAA